MGGDRLDWTNKIEEYLKKNSRNLTIPQIVDDLRLIHQFEVSEANLRNKLKTLNLQFKSTRPTGKVAQEEFLQILELAKQGKDMTEVRDPLKILIAKYEDNYILNTYYKVNCIYRNYPNKDDEELFKIYSDENISNRILKGKSREYRKWTEDDKLELVTGLRSNGAEYYANLFNKSIPYIYHLSSKFSRELKLKGLLESSRSIPNSESLKELIPNEPSFDIISNERYKIILKDSCIVTEDNFSKVVGSLCVFGYTQYGVENIINNFGIKSLLDPSYHEYIGVLKSMTVTSLLIEGEVKKIPEFINDKGTKFRVAISIRDI